MSKADDIFKSMCKNIINNGYWSHGQEIRAKWDDDTPAHTIKQFGVVNRYNLAEEFPIMTLRPTNLKACIDEILWIFQQQSNNVKDLNSKIWNSWAKEDGSIGRAYAYQLESRPTDELILVKQRLKKEQTISDDLIRPLEKPNTNSKCVECGQIMHSKNFGNFIILDTAEDSKRYKIQFLNTGYITNALKNNIKSGEVKDKYLKTNYNVGYLGDYEKVPNFKKGQVDILKNKWRSMLSRCYDKTSLAYSKYGGRGIFVDVRWHSFENFLSDAKYIPQWHLAKDDLINFDLDKDYYKSNCYSLDTCVLLSKEDNMIYREQSSPFVLLCPNGLRKTYISRKKAVCEHDNMSRSTLTQLLSGKKEIINGYKIEHISAEQDKGYRYKISENQVNEVIHKLKFNKYDRRIMTNFWNYREVKDKALMECAYSMTYNVTDNKLNGILNQRSNDILVANNWNVTQYAILIHMFAQVSNLQVGELVHVIADAHIYDKHIPLVEELITRESYPAPKLTINPDITNFYDFTVDDFQLENYQKGKQIKIPVAI